MLKFGETIPFKNEAVNNDLIQLYAEMSSSSSSVQKMPLLSTVIFFGNIGCFYFLNHEQKHTLVNLT